MNKKYLITITLLLLIIAGGFYKFIIQGSSTDSSDGRTEILLDDSERNLVLAEMRAFLSSVQQISQGISEDNMEVIIAAARESGKAAQTGMPGTLVGKLPLKFKKLGGDTHVKFDELAMDASDLGDRDHALQQLSKLMKNCVACHAAYRFSI